MKLKVQPHKITIDESALVNEKEINITKVQFEFVDIPENYVKEAYFTYGDNSYKVILQDNECDIPNEVLQQKGDVEIGCVAYLVDGDNITRYNPSPVYVNTLIGSLKDAQNSEPITPTDKEQIEQAIQDMETKVDNLDIDASKVDKTTTITITKKDGTQETTEILDGNDGKSLEYNWQGTELGVRQEGESSYQYVDLKGDKGDAGAIKMEIVQELPSVGQDDTIYLLPYTIVQVQELPTTGNENTIYIVESTNKRYIYESGQWHEISNDNMYAEYVYVNNNWEKLGGIDVSVNLTDYVKFTDYPTNDGTKSGVIKVSTNDGISVNTSNNRLQAVVTDYGTYQSASNSHIIGKGTLENVITGKGLVSNTDYGTSSVGGVVKNGTTSLGYNITQSGTNAGRLEAQIKSYTQYQSMYSNGFIGKGTLENVLNAKIGAIDDVLDAINGEVI